MKICKIEGCGRPVERERSEFCSASCSHADWVNRNRKKRNAQMRDYMRERSMRKHDAEYPARREAILIKYGVGEKWRKLREERSQQ